MHYDFQPSGVCSRMIHIDLDDDAHTVANISFEGGCDGNLKAISKLVKGMPADQVIELLEGNTCGRRPTSCADQMTIGIREALVSGADGQPQASDRVREASL